MLSLNWNLLFTIINLIVLYLLLKKFLIGPINTIMEKRKTMIEDGLKNAQESQDEATKLKEEYEEALKGARRESEQIIENARTNGKNEYDKIVSEAQEKSGRMLKDAQKNIDIQQEQMKKDMQSEIAGLAMSAAKKIVEGSGKEDTDLYDKFLEEVGDGHENTDND